jgi:hypothetical protein
MHCLIAVDADSLKMCRKSIAGGKNVQRRAKSHVSLIFTPQHR